MSSALSSSSSTPAINTTPAASNVRILDMAGTPLEQTHLGQPLIGDYAYHDSNADLEGTSQYRWLIEGQVVSTQLLYTPSHEDANKALTFEVTPLALTGEPMGEPSLSAQSVLIIDDAAQLTTLAPIILEVNRPWNLRLNNTGSQNIENCTGQLPAGLSVAKSSDGTTCEVSGAVTQEFPATDYTVTASNLGGDSTLTLTLSSSGTASITFFEEGNSNLLSWKTEKATHCAISNSANDALYIVPEADFNDGITLHNLPADTVFTLNCQGAAGAMVQATSMLSIVPLFSKTQGYIGFNGNSTSWAAIVRLSTPIAFTDSSDFYAQTDAYCSDLGYLGAAATSTLEAHLVSSASLRSPNSNFTTLINQANITVLTPSNIDTGSLYKITFGPHHTESTTLFSEATTQGEVNPFVLCQTDTSITQAYPQVNTLIFNTLAAARLALSIDTGATHTAQAQYSPTPITYSSSDPTIATVDAETGLLTPLSAGEVTITASGALTATNLNLAPATASYTTTIDTPQYLEINNFTVDSANAINWGTQHAVNCQIRNDLNSDSILLDRTQAKKGIAINSLPLANERTLTLQCEGERGGINSVVATPVLEPTFQESVGFYVNLDNLGTYWAAIVDLNSPITFTDKYDFNQQANTYCESLGYLGVIKTLSGDFATHPTYYFSRSDGIIAGSGPHSTLATIPEGITYDNVYANRRNDSASNGNPGPVALTRSTRSISQISSGSTEGVEAKVFCQTTIPSTQTFPIEHPFKLSAAAYTMTVGQANFSKKPGYSPHAITYSSSNEALATVNSSGNVTALAEGSVTITLRRTAMLPLLKEATTSYQLTITPAAVAP